MKGSLTIMFTRSGQRGTHSILILENFSNCLFSSNVTVVRDEITNQQNNFPSNNNNKINKKTKTYTKCNHPESLHLLGSRLRTVLPRIPNQLLQRHQLLEEALSLCTFLSSLAPVYVRLRCDYDLVQ